MKKIISLLLLTVIILCAAGNVTYAEETLSDKLGVVSDLYFRKNYEDVILLCAEILAEDDSYMEAYYYTSMSYFYSGDYQNALKTLEKQLEKNPRNELALYNAACASSILGYKEKATGFLSELFEINISQKASVKNDDDFDNIRDTAEYKSLMEISVVALGEKLEFDVAPVIISGRTLVPLRKIFEVLDADVEWIDETQTVIAKKDGVEISLTIGNNTALVNGETRSLDTAPVLRDSRTLIPVRFVSEAFGAIVGWDETNEVVYIDYEVTGGQTKLEDANENLSSDTVVSVVDGVFAEPYLLMATEGMSMIIFKNKETLDLFDSLSVEDKKEYMRNCVFSNYALVVGCENVKARVIFDGKSYYDGEFSYSENNISDLQSYPKGKKVNVVKQYKNDLNYKDFYLLPPEEQTTSVIEEAEYDSSDIIQLADPDRVIIASGDDITGCEAKKLPASDEWVVEIKITPDAQKKFYEATKRLLKSPYPKNYISISVMGSVISAPHVNEAINSDTFIITGAFDENSASYLAELINIHISEKSK